MRMSLQSRREQLSALVLSYKAAGKSEKGRILDGLVASTGYRRKYAIGLLNHPPSVRKRKRPTRKRLYTPDVARALAVLWRASGYVCSKRLVPFLGELMAVLERHGEIALDPRTRLRLQSISAATADRLLATVRRTRPQRGLSTTKPGTLLRHQIPVRTFADWDEDRPGFMEVDLVAHTDTAYGEYVHSLVLTDIATGWTDFASLPNRGQKAVAEAIERVRKRLPFPLLGIDSDNGAEFINNNLYRYCKQLGITFTRSRPYKKNDQCHVEQKNWSIVRQTIGYAAYEGEHACSLMERVYEPLRLHVNYFQPSLKLISKERDGAHVVKHYDMAKTPFQRLLGHGILQEEELDRLAQLYNDLNPMELQKRIQDALGRLLRDPSVRKTDEATKPV